MLAAGFQSPFDDQIAFFKAKLNLPSERWDDIQRSAHDRAFIVAGAMKADLVQDLHDSLAQRMSDGTGLREWRKDFKGIVQKHGWTGWTGQGSKAGEAWRTDIIYQTNMSTAYAAGRYKQLTHPDLLAVKPYWRYNHADGVLHPRPWHLAWNGITLPWDDQWWQTHYTPNGWKCHCWISAASPGEYEAAQAIGKGTRPPGWDVLDPKTGAPLGIDRGFDYAPGANARAPLQQFIDQKLIRLNAPIGAALWQSLKPMLEAERLAGLKSMVATTGASLQAKGDAVSVWTLPPDIVEGMSAQGVMPENAAVWLRDSELLHALRETKSGRGAALPMSTWENLPKHFDDAEVYLDAEDKALLFAFDGSGKGKAKVVVRVNYSDKLRVNGQRETVTANFVRTGGMVEAGDLKNPKLKKLR